MPNKERNFQSLSPRGLLHRYLGSLNPYIYELLDPKTEKLSRSRIADFVPRHDSPVQTATTKNDGQKSIRIALKINVLEATEKRRGMGHQPVPRSTRT